MLTIIIPSGQTGLSAFWCLNSLHFPAMSFHQRIWKHTSDGAELRFILEPFGWVEVGPFSCSCPVIYSLSKYLLITYYMASSVLGDDIILNKIKSLLHRVSTLEGGRGAWYRDELAWSGVLKPVCLGLGVGHGRGWYEMRLQRKAGARSLEPYRPGKEFCLHPKNIGK